MTSINTNYNYYSLANYLSSSTTPNGTSIDNPDNPQSSLLAALDNNSSNSSNTSTTGDGSSDLLNLLEQNSAMRTYNLPMDASGNVIIPTVDEMNSASTPDEQLTLANYVAQSVLMQSDASAKTDNAARVSDITSQAKSVLQALATATTSLTNNGQNSLTSAQQTTTSNTLNAINTTLSQVVNLLPKTDAATRASLTSQIGDLDTLAYNIAGLTATAWTSVTGNSANTIAGYSAATSSTTLNASSLTSSLLNIMV